MASGKGSAAYQEWRRQVLEQVRFWPDRHGIGRELDDHFDLTVQSDVFAPFVELDFDDADVIFSDNFFTVSNEKPVVITLKKEDILQGSFTSATDLKEKLVITTIADTY